MRRAFARLFGAAILDQPRLLVSEAMFAVARYQIEEPSFHPYTSKFDFWLEGKARFTPAEMRGYRAVQRSGQGELRRLPSRQAVAPDGLPPVFTDGQFEALGAPRNPAAGGQPRPGLFRPRHLRAVSRRTCATETQFCGMFITPTLRNVASAPCVLPQRRVHQLAAGDGLLRVSRRGAGEGLSRRERNTTTFQSDITLTSMWWTRHLIVSSTIS